MPRNIPEQAIKAMLSREEALFTQRNPTSKKLSDDAARDWLTGVPMHWNRRILPREPLVQVQKVRTARHVD